MYLKEDGSRLVGQCDISHPIRRHTGPSITFDNEEDSDEVDILTSEDSDDLDGTISKPQNVLFEATKKDEYDPLGSRIAREPAIRRLIIILELMFLTDRTLLYQCVWQRDTPVTQSGLHCAFGYERCPGVLVRLPLD